MANYNPKKLKTLFLDVAKKAKLTLERSDSDFLAQEINDYGDNNKLLLTGEFIYEAQRKIKAAIKKEDESIAFSPTYINRLAQFLDLRDFSQYRIREEEKLNNDPKQTNQTLRNDSQQTTIIGDTIYKIEGDMNNNGTINNN